MRTNQFAHAARCAAFVFAVVAAEAATAQGAKLDTNCVPLLTHQQQRLYSKASEGTDSLRWFVFIRRAILQVDVYDTAIWAESLNAARAMCMRQREVAASSLEAVRLPDSSL